MYRVFFLTIQICNFLDARCKKNNTIINQKTYLAKISAKNIIAQIIDKNIITIFSSEAVNYETLYLCNC